MTRRDFLSTIGAASLGLSMSANVWSRAESDRPVNLLFIMTDQQRWDALSMAGNKILDTPHLDGLARDGVYFENAYSNCPICVPARAVILTGHSIQSVRVTGNGDYDREDVASVPTFDNVLSERGYHTEYYGKWHTPYKFASTYKNPVRQVGKHSRGADIPGQKAAYMEFVNKNVPKRKIRDGELIDKSSERPYTPDPIDWRYGLTPEEIKQLSTREGRKSKLNSQAGSYGCLKVPAEYTRTAFVADEVLGALERVKDRPFSLTCSFGPPHPPMVLPRPYYGMYPIEEMPPPDSIDDPMINSPYASRAATEEMRRYRNKDHIRYMISDYYGLVKEVDDWTGRILGRLEELDLARNTLVVFTSDHGEMLGDHGLHSKMVLYEGSAHIPLLMRLPGLIPGGTVVRNPVSHVDLFATILDYLDISGYTSEGRSLRSLIEGKADTGPDFCVSEWKAKGGPAFMVRTQEWKYICGGSAKSNSIDALYNLKEDPIEVNNLIGNHAYKSQWVKQAKIMKDRLISYMENIHHPYLQGVKMRSI